MKGMSGMNFEVIIKDFNLVEQAGYPEDVDFCYFIWKDSDGGYNFGVGGYSEEECQFYADFGFGGLVYDAKDIVAWKLIGEEELHKK